MPGLLKDITLIESCFKRFSDLMMEDGRTNCIHKDHNQYEDVKNAKIALHFFHNAIETTETLQFPSSLFNDNQTKTLTSESLTFSTLLTYYVYFLNKLSFLFGTVGAFGEKSACSFAIEKITTSYPSPPFAGYDLPGSSVYRD